MNKIKLYFFGKNQSKLFPKQTKLLKIYNASHGKVQVYGLTLQTETLNLKSKVLIIDNPIT